MQMSFEELHDLRLSAPLLLKRLVCCVLPYLALGTIAELFLDGGGRLEVVGLLLQLHDVQLQQLFPRHIANASPLSATVPRDAVAPAVVVEETGEG